MSATDKAESKAMEREVLMGGVDGATLGKNLRPMHATSTIAAKLPSMRSMTRVHRQRIGANRLRHVMYHAGACIKIMLPQGAGVGGAKRRWRLDPDLYSRTCSVPASKGASDPHTPGHVAFFGHSTESTVASASVPSTASSDAVVLILMEEAGCQSWANQCPITSR